MLDIALPLRPFPPRRWRQVLEEWSCEMQFAIQKCDAQQNAVHQKKVKIRKQSKLTGTQCLDQFWRQLKRHVPKEL